MTDIVLDLIEEAHAVAQRCFGEMVRARSYADPKHPATIAYIRAERAVDVLIANAQTAQSWRGDHHVYPAGVGK